MITVEIKLNKYLTVLERRRLKLVLEDKTFGYGVFIPHQNIYGVPYKVGFVLYPKSSPKKSYMYIAQEEMRKDIPLTNINILEMNLTTDFNGNLIHVIVK